MLDMRDVIVPKSDQINADDLIGGTQTIIIRDVQIRGGQEQPVSIFFDGSDKAYRPCKSMSRVLVAAWGPDAKAYVGRSLTLYRDPAVKWAGMEVGGIRISHMSHIDGKIQMALTATKGSRKPYTVLPLVAEVAQIKVDPARKWADAYLAKVSEAQDMDALNTFANDKAGKLSELESKRPELHLECVHALDTRRAELDFQPEGKPDADMGEAFNGADDDTDFGSSTADLQAVRIAEVRAGIKQARSLDYLDALQDSFADQAGDFPPDAVSELRELFAQRRQALTKTQEGASQ